MAGRHGCASLVRRMTAFFEQQIDYVDGHHPGLCQALSEVYTNRDVERGYLGDVRAALGRRRPRLARRRRNNPFWWSFTPPGHRARRRVLKALAREFAARKAVLSERVKS